MEYLQLLLILQHVAVGGTALVGFLYLFSQDDSLIEFLKREIGQWQLRTTLLWLTASFAVSYGIDDLAKQMINDPPGLVYFGQKSLDAYGEHQLLRPFFESDQDERFTALFTPKSDGQYHLTPLSLELLQVLEQNDRRPTQDLDFTSSIHLRLAHVEDPMLDELLGQLPEKMASTALQLRILMQNPGLRTTAVAFTSKDSASIAANHLFYQAHNYVSRNHVYADELNRFYVRLRFLRALGFLSEVFFLAYAIAALFSPDLELKWTIPLAMVGAIFVYCITAESAPITFPLLTPALWSCLFLTLFVLFKVARSNYTLVRRAMLWTLQPEWQQKKVDRSNSLARIAVGAFVSLVICSVGAHSESVELNQRVFGYFVSLSQHPDSAESMKNSPDASDQSTGTD
jgi:hypothetical protein